jgi:outer membrane protein OmpA-like peptidoglycan-associated protein
MTRSRSSLMSMAAALVMGVGAVAAAQGLTSRKTTAVTYEARRDTKVDLVGTPLMPRARGEAQIKTESAGPVQIKAKVRSLGAPGQFGVEYLTYVMWAIPPQGRPKNLGEVRTDEGESEIQATSDVQTFALIVTAEPYYAVTTPSEVVVMENLIREDTKGRTSMTTLQHEIVPRGAYVAASSSSYSLPPFNKKEPPDVQQARNAVAIAQLAQAARFAPAQFATAQQLMMQAEGLVAKGSKRDLISAARAAVQAGEEARLQATNARVAAADQAAKAEAAAREQAARDRAAQEAAARVAAEQERQRAVAAAQQAELDSQQAQATAAQAAEQQRQADELRRQAEAAKAEADAARAAADAARADAQAQATRADALRAQAEQDKTSLRAELLKQFGSILETTDTARGLIVNVGDVLFETGRFELKPAAREKLARFSGIVLAHSGLTVQSEGFTDSTGTLAVNEKLSQQRADAVAQFLMTQGLARDRITAKGYGPSYPVAPNDTAQGRSQNRRVELVVAGDVIGTPISATTR